MAGSQALAHFAQRDINMSAMPAGGPNNSQSSEEEEKPKDRLTMTLKNPLLLLLGELLVLSVTQTRTQSSPQRQDGLLLKIFPAVTHTCPNKSFMSCWAGTSMMKEVE
jgi:hypothetical protein